MKKLNLPKSYGNERWYDKYATFLIKKEKKKEKIDIDKIKLNKPKKQGYIDETFSLMNERIQILRKSSTKAEKLLNDNLINFFGKSSFIFQNGFFFRKKNFFYITDFYFPKQKLVIEVDGNYHKNEDQKEKDILREKTLEKAFHVKILRFSNEQILFHIEHILKVISSKINNSEVTNKFQCKICNAVCKTKNRLNKHYKNSHKY